MLIRCAVFETVQFPFCSVAKGVALDRKGKALQDSSLVEAEMDDALRLANFLKTSMGPKEASWEVPQYARERSRIWYDVDIGHLGS